MPENKIKNYQTYTDIQLKVTRNRRNPDIHIGNNVNIDQTCKCLTKSDVSEWSGQSFMVEDVAMSHGKVFERIYKHF